jgi:hypothetical protein
MAAHPAIVVGLVERVGFTDRHRNPCFRDGVR